MMDPEKPSRNEDEYFARLDLEKKRQWARERSERMAVEERQSLRDLHFMKCPKCGMDLQQFDLEGVRVDRCLSCNGTWFDAGEIDQLLAGHEHGIMHRVVSFFR